MSTLERGMSTSDLEGDFWEEIARATAAGTATETHFDYGAVHLLLGIANQAISGPAVGLTEDAMAAIAQRQAADRRQQISRLFAERALAVPGVREVRLTASERELVVTVLTDDRDMERDLRLHALFFEVTTELGADSELQTLVFSEESAEQAGTLLP